MSKTDIVYTLENELMKIIGSADVKCQQLISSPIYTKILTTYKSTAEIANALADTIEGHDEETLKAFVNYFKVELSELIASRYAEVKQHEQNNMMLEASTCRLTAEILTLVKIGLDESLRNFMEVLRK